MPNACSKNIKQFDVFSFDDYRKQRRIRFLSTLFVCFLFSRRSLPSSTETRSAESMPVPRRRKKPGVSIAISPSVFISNLFNIDYIFQRSKTLLYYSFAPLVVYYGMTTEPRPASWLELINIF